MFPNFSGYTTGLTNDIKAYMANNYVPLGGSLTTTIGNTLFVAKTGDDTSNGSITRPFLTIQKAINTATNGTTIYIFSGTYTENLVLKDGIILEGASKYQTVIKGTINLGLTSSTSYLNNLLIQGDADITIDFIGTATEKEVLYINNCILESNNSQPIVDYSNENIGSELRIKDSTLNVYISTFAECILSRTSSKGNIYVDNCEMNLIDSNDNIAVELYGAVSYTQNGGNINGQVVVQNTSSATLSYLNINTISNSCITTNSTGISSVTNSIMSTNNQFFATGTGNFYYANIITDRETSSMLNGGIGAKPYTTNGLLLNTTNLVTNDLIATGEINGLIETDGTKLYCILSNTRKNILDYLNLENKPSIPTKLTDLSNDLIENYTEAEIDLIFA